MKDALLPRKDRLAEPNSLSSYLRWAYVFQYFLLLSLASMIFLRSEAPEQRLAKFEEIAAFIGFVMSVNMLIDNIKAKNPAIPSPETEAASEPQIVELPDSDVATIPSKK